MDINALVCEDFVRTNVIEELCSVQANAGSCIYTVLGGTAISMYTVFCIQRRGGGSSSP